MARNEPSIGTAALSPQSINQAILIDSLYETAVGDLGKSSYPWRFTNRTFDNNNLTCSNFVMNLVHFEKHEINDLSASTSS